MTALLIFSQISQINKIAGTFEYDLWMKIVYHSLPKANFGQNIRDSSNGSLTADSRSLRTSTLKKRKLTVTLFITTLISFLFLFNSLSLPENFRLAYSSRFLYFANSAVNPIIYVVRMPDFKKALLSLSRRRPQRENVAIPLNHY